MCCSRVCSLDCLFYSSFIHLTSLQVYQDLNAVHTPMRARTKKGCTSLGIGLTRCRRTSISGSKRATGTDLYSSPVSFCNVNNELPLHIMLFYFLVPTWHLPGKENTKTSQLLLISLTSSISIWTACLWLYSAPIIDCGLVSTTATICIVLAHCVVSDQDAFLPNILKFPPCNRKPNFISSTTAVLSLQLCIVKESYSKHRHNNL